MHLVPDNVLNLRSLGFTVYSLEPSSSADVICVCSLRTIRGERADLYGVHIATLQSALEGMVPNDRANWKGQLSGRLREVLGYGFTI